MNSRTFRKLRIVKLYKFSQIKSRDKYKETDYLRIEN